MGNKCPDIPRLAGPLIQSGIHLVASVPLSLKVGGQEYERELDLVRRMDRTRPSSAAPTRWHKPCTIRLMSSYSGTKPRTLPQRHSTMGAAGFEILSFLWRQGQARMSVCLFVLPTTTVQYPISLHRPSRIVDPLIQQVACSMRDFRGGHSHRSALLFEQHIRRGSVQINRQQ